MRQPSNNWLFAIILWLLFSLLAVPITIFALSDSARSAFLGHIESRLCYSSTSLPSSPEPSISPLIKTFRAFEKLEDLSPSNDKNWETAVFNGSKGVIWVTHNGTFNQPWGVSMLHALHCLKMLRSAIQSQDSATSSWPTFHSQHTNPQGSTQLGLDHLGHCIGYIAQVGWSGDEDREL